jgi:hypothetical protein
VRDSQAAGEFCDHFKGPQCMLCGHQLVLWSSGTAFPYRLGATLSIHCCVILCV